MDNSVHLAVAQVLRADHDYKGMEEWFGPAWELCGKTPAMAFEADQWDRWARADQERLAEAVGKPYAEALKALGRGEEARAVERTLRAMVTRQTTP